MINMAFIIMMKFIQSSIIFDDHPLWINNLIKGSLFIWPISYASEGKNKRALS